VSVARACKPDYDATVVSLSPALDTLDVVCLHYYSLSQCIGLWGELNVVSLGSLTTTALGVSHLHLHLSPSSNYAELNDATLIVGTILAQSYITMTGTNLQGAAAVSRCCRDPHGRCCAA